MKVNFILPGSPVRTALSGLMKVILPFWCKAFYRFEVLGKNNIPDTGPAIIVPKHQYWTDIPFIGLAFHTIQLSYIAKQELFRFPLISHFLAALGGIPLDRQSPIKSLDSFRYLSNLLRHGHQVVIFPEGTYYRGVVGKGKSRLISMVLKFQEAEKRPHPIPFIPVGISYGKRRMRQTVRMSIGTPLYRSQESEAKELTRKIMQSIARLSDMEISPG